MLSGGIAVLDLRGVSTRIIGVQGVELSETVRRMEESIPLVILLLEAATERCISFTGGSELDELILALDDVTMQYITTLQGNLKALRAVCGVEVAVDNVGKKETGSDRKEAASHARKVDLMSNEEEWSFVQGALQILTVADCLTSRISVFEASLKSTLARLSTNLSFSVYGSNLDQNQSHLDENDGTGGFSTAGKASLDVAALRLLDVPEKARKLFNLLEQVLVIIHMDLQSEENNFFDFILHYPTETDLNHFFLVINLKIANIFYHVQDRISASSGQKPGLTTLNKFLLVPAGKRPPISCPSTGFSKSSSFLRGSQRASV